MTVRSDMSDLLPLRMKRTVQEVVYHSTPCLKKKRPTFELLQSWYTRSNYDNVWQKCYWESKKSDNAVFSHLTYLVLQHYLAKQETQKTAHWCIVRVTQSNCCSTLSFLSPELCTPTAWDECTDYKI